jgi:hypothetical protein
MLNVVHGTMMTVDDILTRAKPLTPEKKQIVSLLPVLEYPWSEAISQQIYSVGFQPDKIIALALSEGSDYWFGLAVRWVEAGYPISEQLATTLEEFGRGKMGSQRDRHVALKRAAEWKREMQNNTLEGTD